MKLSERFSSLGSDKNMTHSYGEFYDSLSEHLPEAPTILEIGVEQGHSLQAWKDHFPAGRVIGADKHVGPEGAKLRIKDKYGLPYHRRSGLEVLRCCTPDYAPLITHFKMEQLTFDLIVDDGSHSLVDQSLGLLCLSSFLKPVGIYVIEDLQTEEAIQRFRELSCKVIDLRHVKGRSDDLLAVRGGQQCDFI